MLLRREIQRAQFIAGDFVIFLSITPLNPILFQRLQWNSMSYYRGFPLNSTGDSIELHVITEDSIDIFMELD
jgi:hypothetical protein